jgi:Flp pilus assembly protein TadD
MKENKVEKLLEKVRSSTSKFKVWKQADPNTISLYETALGVLLPDDFKSFLEYTNGLDEIVLTEEAKFLWQQGEYEEARNLGSKILSVEEIFEEYEEWSVDDYKIPDGYTGFYPYIPFCITEENEKLVFLNQELTNDQTIFYAYHDEPASGWTAVAQNFTEFLEFYIKSKGKTPDKDVGVNLNAENFLAKYNAELIQQKLNDPKEEVKRSTAYIELFPDDALTYTIRGNALVKLNEYGKALNDFNKAIEIAPSSDFAYYCRGEMFMKVKKARQALTDFDSACKLRADDVYCLTSRADAFYELNRMDKALADCNRAIELDNRFSLAYMTRHKIYLYQGEAEKAEADAKIIDELLAEE